MSKNMTQKGLAFGAAAALAITGFSVPANALGLADNSFVSLTPPSGTSYAVFAEDGNTFTLTANETSTIAGGNLKFLVEDAGELVEPAVTSAGRTLATLTTSDKVAVAHATNTVTLTDMTGLGTISVGDVVVFGADIKTTTGTDVVAATGTAYTVTAVDADNNAFSFVSATADVVALSANLTIELLSVGGSVTVIREARNATTKHFVVDTGTNSASTTSTLVLEDSSSDTKSINVTAWVDSNGNDLLDSTEYASPTRAVQFIKPSEVTGVVTMTQALLDESTLSASLVLTPALNGAQVVANGANDLAVGFTRQGVAGTNYDPTATWDATNSEFDFSIATNAAAVNGSAPLNALTGALFGNGTTASNVVAGTYSSTAYWYAATNKSATATMTVAAVVADDIKASVAASADVTPAKSETGASASTVTIRKGATTVDVVAKVYDDEGVLVGAGVPVTATFSNVVGTHKVNTTTAADSGTKTALTDATGTATFTVVSSTAAASNRLDLLLTAQGVTGSSNVSQAKFSLNWSTATYEIFDRNDDGAAFGGSHNIHRSMNKGGSYTFDFAVVDQWGQPIADGHRLRIAATGRTVGTSFATVTGGRASYTLTDGGITATTDGAVAVDVTIEQASGANELVTVDEFVSGENNAFSVDILDESNVVVLGADTSTDYAGATVDVADNMSKSDTLQAIDTRLANVLAPATGLVLVAGQIDNSITADPREGAVVTISGDAGFLFQDGAKNSYGSITTLADSNGEFAVTIASNKAATDSVITVTANGASKTIKVSFAAAAATEGTSLVIAAPAAAMPGSTFKVTATLTDKYGNAVAVGTAGDVAVSYTGPGIVFGNLPNTLDSKGQLSFAVLLGSNDSGTATITVSYDQSSDGDFTGTAAGDLDIVKAASVLVGTSEANQGVLATWTKNLGDGTAKMYAKNVLGQGKVQFMLNGKEIAWTNATTLDDYEGGKLRVVGSSNYLVRTVDLKDGKNVLEIYVDGYRMKRVVYSN